MHPGTPVTLRCPACGGTLAAIPEPNATSYVACPHCAAAVPVVGLRDPPPLFVWEVMPHLYPPLPPLSAGPRRSARPLLVALLSAGVVLLAVAAGLLLHETAVALAPGSVDLSGRVVSGGALIGKPIAGAQVSATGENGYWSSLTTDAAGQFDFPNVPVGEVTLAIAAPGYPNVTLDMFFSPDYSAPARASGLEVTLGAAGAASSVTRVYTPFGSLEELAANLLSGAVVFAVGVVVAGAGVVAVARQRRLPLAIAGSAGLVAAPLVLPVLTITSVSAVAVGFAVAAAAVGAVEFVLIAVPMALTAPAPDS
ncbi:MAG TPA: carboxypeptidase-like regulatory domain-containing protein [Thermoplasmata archaeon]|nr:carboxypeptidase-like regulatory domain-containing protein [Thermoplasmata archaeon]